MAVFSPDAVIYDLDGTLVHSSPDIAFHLNAALLRHVDGADGLLERDIELMIGGGLKDLIRQGIEAAGGVMTDALFDQVLASYRDDYLDRPVVHTTLYDGVVAMVAGVIARGA
ncbi:MAG: phosphoglycolate phosphatase, partial [Alphaproteobacteria bacterium]|nr:phosphoglycolate phosphatase [Alphaproteobacteria bacterium]